MLSCNAAVQYGACLHCWQCWCVCYQVFGILCVDAFTLYQSGATSKSIVTSPVDQGSKQKQMCQSITWLGTLRHTCGLGCLNSSMHAILAIACVDPWDICQQRLIPPWPLGANQQLRRLWEWMRLTDNRTKVGGLQCASNTYGVTHLCCCFEHNTTG